MTLFSFTRVYPFSKWQKAVLVFVVALVIGAIALIAFKTPNYGIDFAGGTIVQARYIQGAAPKEAIEEALKGGIFDGAQVQEFGSPQEVVIKAPAASNALGLDVGDQMREILKDTGEFEIRKVDMVGAKVGEQLRTAGLMAIVVALIGILIYIALRFEWRFAIAATLCAIHDILLTVGFILLFDIPVNLDILAALLTVLGYSLNDTIVVFDRIREIMGRAGASKLSEIIDEAISRTLSRTTLTSFTTLFVVFATYAFGGELLKPLSLVLIAGITIGTLSSIFVAASLLSPLGVSVSDWRAREAKRAQEKAEKARMRAMYEKGAV
ncbi:MAG: protein translocase subunit SecF [Helicobacteraceae bacterium]|jgi:preprotein translocase subunit SecF|nr:protein translocase subunit SecF [Helicobacteraceae bacterium]